MGHVVSFSEAKSDKKQAETQKKVAATRRFMKAAVQTPFVWMGQIGLELVAFMLPVFRALGKLSLLFLVAGTCIIWLNHWKYATLLAIPVALVVTCSVLHVIAETTLKRFGREPI